MTTENGPQYIPPTNTPENQSPYREPETSATVPPASSQYSPPPSTSTQYPIRERDADRHQNTDTKSIIALSLAIGSFIFLGLVLSVPAVLLASDVLRINPKDNKASAARIIGWVNIIISVVLFVAFWVLLLSSGNWFDDQPRYTMMR